MTWTRGLPLGLAKVVHTVGLADHTGFTHLTVSETARGPLRRLLRTSGRDTEQTLGASQMRSNSVRNYSASIWMEAFSRLPDCCDRKPHELRPALTGSCNLCSVAAFLLRTRLGATPRVALTCSA